MIKTGNKLPPDIMKRVGLLPDHLQGDESVCALYLHGSAATGNMTPLSDLDFGLLLRRKMSKEDRFDKLLKLTTLFMDILETDEFDLVLMNEAPPRIPHKIIKTGKLLYVNDYNELIDFVEINTKLYLDFKPLRDEYNAIFLDKLNSNL
jgi:hypothetical protein